MMLQRSDRPLSPAHLLLYLSGEPESTQPSAVRVQDEHMQCETNQNENDLLRRNLWDTGLYS